MKNTQLFILLFAIMFLSPIGLNISILHSQTLHHGYKIGFSVPQLSDNGNNEISSGYKSRFAPAFGIFLNDYFTPNFALQLELLYVGQGGKRNEMQPIPEEELAGLPVPPGVNLYADFENEAILNYLEIPLLAMYKIHLSDIFNIYGEFGPYFGILINAKSRTSGTSSIYLDKEGNIPLTDIEGNPLPEIDFNNERTISDDIQTLNFGLTGGVGVGFKIGSSELILDIRGSGGFTHIQKDIKDGQSTTGALVVTAGYSLEL